MSVLAIIPARKGSKGIPKKNIKLLCGKPLIAWSIEQAIASKSIDNVIVSTDSREIADISISYGAEVPFLRPDDLSNDTATTESALIHCCEFLYSKQMLPKTMVLLQCTSPLRFKDTLDRAIKYFYDNNFDSLLSVSEFKRFIWKDEDNPTASYDFIRRPRRQDFESKEFLETGSFYIFNALKFLKEGNRLFGKIGLFQTKEIESYEIDTYEDFKICEALMNEFIDL